MSSVDVATSTVVARPVDAVAAYAADPSNAPSWYTNIESVTWRTEPPVAVGTQVDFVARFLGRRLAYTYEVVELEPNHRFVMRTAQGPFPMETTYTWERHDGGTRMTLRNRGEPTGFAVLVRPFMVRAMRRANTKDLARLKALLERARPTQARSAAARRHASAASSGRWAGRTGSCTKPWSASG